MEIMEIHVDSSGFLSWCDAAGASRKVRCAVGLGGINHKKTEGDAITPIGRFPLRSVMVRADRVSSVPTALPVTVITKTDGWCDDPSAADYNKRIALPHPANHEVLWRADAVYDVIVEVGYNDDPVKAGAGSAIFIHVARPDYAPTQGCVALALDDLLDLLKDCKADSALVID